MVNGWLTSVVVEVMVETEERTEKKSQCLNFFLKKKLEVEMNRDKVRVKRGRPVDVVGV